MNIGRRKVRSSTNLAISPGRESNSSISAASNFVINRCFKNYLGKLQEKASDSESPLSRVVVLALVVTAFLLLFAYFRTVPQRTDYISKNRVKLGGADSSAVAEDVLHLQEVSKDLQHDLVHLQRSSDKLSEEIKGLRRELLDRMDVERQYVDRSKAELKSMISDAGIQPSRVEANQLQELIAEIKSIKEAQHMLAHMLQNSGVGSGASTQENGTVQSKLLRQLLNDSSPAVPDVEAALSETLSFDDASVISPIEIESRILEFCDRPWTNFLLYSHSNTSSKNTYVHQFDRLVKAIFLAKSSQMVLVVPNWKDGKDNEFQVYFDEHILEKIVPIISLKTFESRYLPQLVLKHSASLKDEGFTVYFDQGVDKSLFESLAPTVSRFVAGEGGDASKLRGQENSAPVQFVPFRYEGGSNVLDQVYQRQISLGQSRESLDSAEGASGKSTEAAACPYRGQMVALGDLESLDWNVMSEHMCRTFGHCHDDLFNAIHAHLRPSPPMMDLIHEYRDLNNISQPYMGIHIHSWSEDKCRELISAGSSTSGVDLYNCYADGDMLRELVESVRHQTKAYTGNDLPWQLYVYTNTRSDLQGYLSESHMKLPVHSYVPKYARSETPFADLLIHTYMCSHADVFIGSMYDYISMNVMKTRMIDNHDCQTGYTYRGRTFFDCSYSGGETSESNTSSSECNPAFVRPVNVCAAN